MAKDLCLARPPLLLGAEDPTQALHLLKSLYHRANSTTRVLLEF